MSLKLRPHCPASPAGISAAAAAASNSCHSSLLGLFYLSVPLGQRRYGAELNISRTRRFAATFDPPRQPVKHLISELSPCLSSAVFSPLSLFSPSLFSSVFNFSPTCWSSVITAVTHTYHILLFFFFFPLAWNCDQNKSDSKKKRKKKTNHFKLFKVPAGKDPAS